MNTDFRYCMDLICQCPTERVTALDKYLLDQTSESYYRITGKTSELEGHY